MGRATGSDILLLLMLLVRSGGGIREEFADAKLARANKRGCG